MTTCLAGLPLLEHLRIEYESSASRPNQTNPLLSTRAVLPTLAYFFFKGASEYLDDFVAQIDAPALQTFVIKFNRPIFHIHIPQLCRFISQAGGPKLPTRAMVYFGVNFAYIWRLPSDSFSVTIRFREGVSTMALVCQELSPFLSHVERLELHGKCRPRDQLNPMNMDPPPWPELFHPFITVQSLCVSAQLAPLIVPALQDLTGARAIEVLPELRTLFLGSYQPYSSVQEAIEPFVAACQRTDHPVVVQRWSIDRSL